MNTTTGELYIKTSNDVFHNVCDVTNIALNNEITRATSAEETLISNLDAEISIRQAFDNAHNNLENGEGQKTLKQVIPVQQDILTDFRFYGAAWALASAQIGGGNPTTEQVEAVMDNAATNTYDKCIDAMVAATGYPRAAVVAQIDQTILEQFSQFDLLDNKSLSTSSIAFGVNNTNNSPISIVAGYGNTLGRKGYPQASMGSTALGMGLTILGTLCFASGLKRDFSVSNFTSSVDIQNARKTIALWQENGFIDTGKTKEQIIAGQADSYVVNFGEVNGNVNTMFGSNTIKDGSFNLVSGFGNIVDGQNNLISGNQNSVDTNNSFVGGLTNFIKHGSGNLVFGTQNEITNIINSLIFGTGNNISSSSLGELVFALGNHLKASNISRYGTKTFLGRYNDEKENTIVEVGCGTSNNYRANAFEVYMDGHAEVGKMGTTNMSVATKLYVDNAIQTSITTVLNTSI